VHQSQHLSTLHTDLTCLVLVVQVGLLHLRRSAVGYVAYRIARFRRICFAAISSITIYIFKLACHPLINAVGVPPSITNAPEINDASNIQIDCLLRFAPGQDNPCCTRFVWTCYLHSIFVPFLSYDVLSTCIGGCTRIIFRYLSLARDAGGTDMLWRITIHLKHPHRHT
jgi:hypothetical protein